MGSNPATPTILAFLKITSLVINKSKCAIIASRYLIHNYTESTADSNKFKNSNYHCFVRFARSVGEFLRCKNSLGTNFITLPNRVGQGGFCGIADGFGNDDSKAHPLIVIASLLRSKRRSNLTDDSNKEIASLLAALAPRNDGWWAVLCATLIPQVDYHAVTASRLAMTA